MKKLLLVLGLLGIITGIICRIILLGISFEYDEIFTAVTANPTLPLSYIWNHYLIVDVHPPLHNLLLWTYNHLVPYGPEWILRLPSLIWSLIGLFLAWTLFPRYLLRTTRWIFMLLLSCNFYLLLYAQHARAYSLMLCLALILTFLYLSMARCVRHKIAIPIEWWVWYGICSLFLCWSHYFGALLFGLFSVILFISAWKKKQPLKVFIVVPLLVFVAFLPWIIPNLLQNLSLHRFSGNWWGNSHVMEWHLVILWIEFFFSSLKAFYVLIGLGILGIAYSCTRFKHRKVWPFNREILFVFIPMATAGIFALLMSFKIFWLLWRYFIPFIPCLYLFVALIISPLCKRYRIISLIFLIFVGLSFHAFIRLYPFFNEGRFFPARPAMEMYQKAFADKELYAVAMEAFPVESMQPMYAFYPNHYFHMNQPVYEIFHMDPAKRDQLLAREGKFIMWMPNCDPHKMKNLVQTFQRNAYIFAHLYSTCFIIPAGEDRRTVAPQLKQEYTRRFEQYQKQKFSKAR
ncbi:MAG: glycosyltransferase family 39 protein [Bacteroidales bacterium]|nr:glycosyltransferase family 39 protein [Bacteroidales bacterium]